MAIPGVRSPLPLPPRHSEPRREVEEAAVQTEVGGEGRARRDEDKGECDRKRPGHDQVLHHCGASVPYASIAETRNGKDFVQNVIFKPEILSLCHGVSNVQS